MTRLSLLVMASILLAALVARPAQAQRPAVAGVSMDPTEMGTFLDDLIGGQLEKHHVAGATVAVVKDGQLFFARGYGFADLEQRLPVSAEQTLFRIGSTSKLFTWTAVMQLVEQGKLDLDADVNQYLKEWQIPATYPQPITMRHLMSHTAGFEEADLNGWARGPEALLSLRDFVARHRPARVRPPGEVTAYSNYGVTLAGYIVAEVSGLPFEQYVEENILRPLQMSRSTFRQPVPQELSAAVAMGYDYDGSFQAAPFEYINLSPAGAMSATATDMARFMIAHLQDGRYGEARILRSETAQQMHSRLFANDPRLSGMAYGFMEFRLNGQRVLEHGGSTIYSHGMLALLPEQNLGVYVAYNSVGGWAARDEFLPRFLDHYYPQPTGPAPVPLDGAAAQAGRFAGAYRMTRINSTSIDRALSLMGRGFGQVSAHVDGSLTFSLWGLRPPSRYVPVEPLLFRSTDGRETIAFQADGQERISYLFLDSAPHWALEKVAWYEAPPFSQALAAASLALFLTVLVVGGLSALAGRRRPAQGPWPEPGWPRAGRVMAVVVSGLNLLFTLGLLRFLQGSGSQYGIPPYFLAALGLALGAAVLTPALVACAVLAWRRACWSLAARVHYTLVALAATVFACVLSYWNLLGFSLG